MASLQLLERQPGLWRLRVREAGRDAYLHVRGDRATAELAGQVFLADVVDNGLPPPKRGQRKVRSDR